MYSACYKIYTNTKLVESMFKEFEYWFIFQLNVIKFNLFFSHYKLIKRQRLLSVATNTTPLLLEHTQLHADYFYLASNLKEG